MEFCKLVAFYNGKPEHDKFLAEIERKHRVLVEIYNIVDPMIKALELNYGYDEIGNMIRTIKSVRSQLINLSYTLQDAAEKLES